MKNLIHVLRYIFGSHHYRLCHNELSVKVRDKHGNLKHHAKVRNLRPNVGSDFFHAQMFGTPGTVATYLALTANSGFTPVATDTTLAGELTTNGLARAAGTAAHTTGSGTSTISHTWTYSGSTLVTFSGVALLNAASGGTLVGEATLPTAPTVQSSGDTINVTYTENY